MTATAIARAVARARDRLAGRAGPDLPEDVAVTRTETGLRLSAPGLLRRWAGDARLWGFLPSAKGRRR